MPSSPTQRRRRITEALQRENAPVPAVAAPVSVSLTLTLAPAVAARMQALAASIGGDLETATTALWLAALDRDNPEVVTVARRKADRLLGAAAYIQARSA